MPFKLLDRLAQKVLGDFGSWFVSEDDLKIDESKGDLAGVNSNLAIAGVEEALDRLDNKAGALLTHISMMVAAASFMIAGEDTSTVERIVVGLEIVGYLFFALICLRCLVYRDLLASGDQRRSSLTKYGRGLRKEVLFRSKLLNLSLRWIFLITFVFLLSVIAHIFL